MDYKISIVIPAYNTGEKIRRCIESVINQTYTNIELIIVDDGSTDNTGAICDEYAKIDNRIIVVHKENGGVSSARNTGIDLSTGDYLLFIDSDDYVDSNYIELFIDAKKNHPDYDNIWCGIDLDSNNVGIDKSSFTRCDFISLYYNLNYCSGSPCNKLYSINLIKKHRLYMPKDISLGEDLIFNLNYLNYNNGLIYLIDNYAYHYDLSSQTSLTHKYRFDLYYVNNEVNNNILHYLHKWKADKSQFDLLDKKIFSNYLDALFNTFNKNNKDSFLTKIRFNNSILRNNDFIRLLDIFGNEINPFLLKLYKTKQYLLVYLALKFVKR